MSQVCPSSSHQLVAAAIAFRRARRKFPKDYGLSRCEEDTPKATQMENITVNENLNDQETLGSSAAKCASTKLDHTYTKSTWNNERGQNSITQENLFQKPIICSCCRKRNATVKINGTINILKPGNEDSAGDALGTVLSRMYSGPVTLITETNNFDKSKQLENCDTKAVQNSETGSTDFTRQVSCSCPRRRSQNGSSSKLNSVDLLYDRCRDNRATANYCTSLSGRNCHMEECNCNCDRTDHKVQRENSPAEVDLVILQKEMSMPCSSEFSTAKRSNPDLLQQRQDNCHRPNSSSRQDSHRHCFNQDRNSCSKEKPSLASDTCLCSSKPNSNQRAYMKTHCTSNLTCAGNCHLKNSEKVFTVEEQDEEYDDFVGVINHKDSLCLLVEKYKTSKKCKRQKFVDELDFYNDRIPDDCNKLLNSETNCKVNVNGNRDTKDEDKSLSSGADRPRENHLSVGKACRHGCAQILKGNDYRQLKTLKSRLIRTGTCYSPKGTPWRHSF